MKSATVLLTEHRMDDVWTMDLIAVLDEGTSHDSTPADIGRNWRREDHPMANACTHASGLFHQKRDGEDLRIP